MRNPQGKRSKPAEMREIEIRNYDLDAANVELAAEINSLNQKVIELRAMHIEDLHYKEKVEGLI